MTQEPQKNNSVLIAIAIIGVIGTIVASAIGAMANYNVEKERQGFELTRIALVSIATQGGVTQMALESTVNAPPEPTATSYPTYTPFPTFPPTETPIPTPTATLFVPPADGILFQDNFDDGISPEWAIESGKWLVANGKLTKLAGDHNGNDYQWISLKKPEWKNYILSIDINKSYTDSVVVAVRNSSGFIGFTASRSGHVDLVLISSNWVDDTLIAGSSGVDIQSDNEYHYQIEVQGDTYILKLNGREIQRVTMSGYESGGITLGVNCEDPFYRCASFDNVKVTYLP